MINLLIIFLVCLFLSAFLSACEMAFVSSNKIKLREKADAGNFWARRVVDLQNQPQYFLTAILIGNNVFNIAATSIVAYWFGEYLKIENEWIVTAITAPILIVFGETVPKDFGRMRAEGMLLTAAPILEIFVKVMYWPSRLLLRAMDFVVGSSHGEMDKSIFVSEKEFRSLIEESAATGVLAKHEKQIMDTILDFERIHVESVMIPVDRIVRVPITATVGEVKTLMKAHPVRMVLVYEEIPSIVVGMVYVFDLLFEEDNAQGLKTFLRSPIFLNSQTSIEKAFLTLQNKRQSFAAVTDAHGEVVGAVPLDRLFTL